MFTVTKSDIDVILQDYGILEKTTEFTELQRYHYEKHDPASKEVRLIIKVRTDDDHSLVIRFKNEEDVTLDIIEEQSRFAALLYANRIETPKIYSTGGSYARWYSYGEYSVIVTVEDFVSGELTEVDVKTAEETGALLARMHHIAEENQYHVQNDVLFHALKKNDLFSFEEFAKQEDYLKSIDETLYNKIIGAYEEALSKVRCFEEEPQYAVQGDISDCNLYRTNDGSVGVFDFNRCGDNVLYFDVIMQAVFEARLMDYPEDLKEDPEKVILPAFLKGYHKERPFTKNQQEVYPYLYALISAFWLSDMKWDDESLINAVQKEDALAAQDWLEEIYRRITYRPKMPI